MDAETPQVRSRRAARHLRLGVTNMLLASPGHRFRQAVLRYVAGASIGSGTVVERGCRVTCKGGVTIGQGCIINSGTLLDGRGTLTIGDKVNVSRDVLLLSASHDVDAGAFDYVTAPVVLEDFTWVSTRSVVLPGVSLRVGSVAAAGAVITKDLPPWTVWGGNPPKRIKERSPEAQRELSVVKRFFH